MEEELSANLEYSIRFSQRINKQQAEIVAAPSIIKNNNSKFQLEEYLI